MLPGDRLVCALIEPQPIGTTFQKWLLHVTIVPWFRLEDSSDQIARGLAAALTPVSPFTARVGEETLMGPRRNRPAHLLEPSDFTEVEQRVRIYLHKKRAWLVDETTKRRYDFRPHVTFQGNEHLQSGQTLACDRLYVIEQHGAHKEVVAIIPLSLH